MRITARVRLTVAFWLVVVVLVAWVGSQHRTDASTTERPNGQALAPMSGTPARTESRGAPSEPGNGARSEGAPVGGLPFSPSQVVEQVRSSFEVTPDGFRGGRATYGVRVSEQGIALEARHWPNGKPADGASRARVETPESRRSGDEEEPIESHELVLKTRHVGRGVALPSEDQDAIATLDDQARRLTWERGEHTETLRQLPGGVEQTWEFPQLPEGRGELLVRVEVSGLDYVKEDEGGLHFADARGLGFRYGHGTWIDAAGARTAVRARYHEGSIALAVPSDVVERSAYPAVLDPVVGPELAFAPVFGPAFGEHTEPSVASNGTNYLVAWRDDRINGLNDLYAARVSSSGVVEDLSGFAVSTATASQQAPHVASNGTDYLVVWQDNRSGNFDIYASRVTAAGVVQDGVGFAVSTAANAQSAPKAASTGSGYLVVWNDGRSGTGDIYASRVSAAGDVQDAEGIAVSTASSDQYAPCVASNGTDYFVAWADSRALTHTDIYGTRVSAAGAVQDADGVAVSSASFNQNYPSIASNGDGYLVAWMDQRNGTAYSDIYASRVSATGVVEDPDNLAVTTAAGTQMHSSVAAAGSGYLVVWTDFRAGDSYDVYASRVSAAGEVQDGAGVIVSSAPGDQTRPSVASNGSGYFVVWQDERVGDAAQVFGSRLNASAGVLDASGVVVSSARSTQDQPSVAASSSGYLVVWQDFRTGEADLHASRVSVAGAIQDTTGFLVADAVGNQINAAVASDGTDYLLAWEDWRDAVSNVYFRRITAQGVAESEVMAPTITPLNNQGGPAVSSNGSGYLLAWVSNGNILATRVTAAGAKQGSNLVICQEASTQWNPTVASNGTDYLVAWQDGRGPSVDVYANRVTSTGSIVDGAGLALSTAGNWQSFPSAASNGAEYLVVWQDLRSFSTNDIYARRVPFTGTSLFGEFVISNAPGSQERPSVTSNGSDFLVVWDDERAGNKDIYGATVSFTPTTTLTEFAIDTSAENASAPSVIHRNGEYLVSYEERENYIPRVHSRLLTGCSGDPSDDADGDGVCDGADNCEAVANADQANADGDDAGDACDECDADPGKSLPGACGCGTPDTDGDSDGTPDCQDACPSDPSKVTAGQCGCGASEADGDGDGTPNCNDACPLDADDDCEPVGEGGAGGVGGEGGELGVSGAPSNGEGGRGESGGRSGSGGGHSTGGALAEGGGGALAEGGGGTLAEGGAGVGDPGDGTDKVGRGDAGDPSGCGCRTRGRADGSVARILLALSFGLLARRRRLRRGAE